MSVVRIRGLWDISLTLHTLDDGRANSIAGPKASLLVKFADRSRLEGEFMIGSEQVAVKGRIRPGNPGVVYITEVSDCGEPIGDGLEAIIYIPPFWPTIAYNYDMVVGSVIISSGSVIKGEGLIDKPFSLSGIKQLPVLDISGV